MKDWYTVYSEQINKKGGAKEYMAFKISHKKKLLKVLRKFSGSGKLIEAGCGTGIITSQLASEGYDVVGVDIDKNILKLAQQLEVEYFGINKAKFVDKSIFALDFPEKSFDLCFSCGVLEHFEDDMIIDSIKQQIRIAKTVIIVIPTKWFNDNEALHGDDRFLKLSYWRSLIEKSGGVVTNEYSYPFKFKFPRNLKYILRIFRPKAYRIFVVEEETD